MPTGGRKSQFFSLSLSIRIWGGERQRVRRCLWRSSSWFLSDSPPAVPVAKCVGVAIKMARDEDENEKKNNQKKINKKKLWRSVYVLVFHTDRIGRDLMEYLRETLIQMHEKC